MPKKDFDEGTIIVYEGSLQVSQRNLSKTTIDLYFKQIPMVVTTWENPTIITLEVEMINLNFEYEQRQVAKKIEKLRRPSKVKVA